MKVAFVTGGSRGIGRAVVEELVCAGYAVAFSYASDDEAAAQVVERAAAQGGRIAAFRADVRNYVRACEVVAEAQQSLGPIDLLVNNAGIRRDTALVHMDAAAWQDVIDINLTGTFNYTRAVVGGMLRRRGAVVNVTSTSGITGMAGQCNYSASKAGVIGFTKAMAKEMARFGVRVNAVAPGFIDTDMTASMDELTRKKLYAQIPLGKPGTPQQVARMVVYLASDEASYITGQVFAIDGGLS